MAEPSAAALALAQQTLSLVPPVMWARVDVLDIDGPLLNELELIDPNLLMSLSADRLAYRWLADAIERRLSAECP